MRVDIERIFYPTIEGPLTWRRGVTLTQRWVSEPHEGSEMNDKKLIRWACCCGCPVFGFRGVFTEVSSAETVEATQLLMDDQ